MSAIRSPSATADRKSTRLNSRHVENSYAVFCLKKTTIDYLRARTVTCEGPCCGAEVPMLRSPRLAKNGERSFGTPPLVRSPTFFFTDTAHTEIYTLSLHDALPI